MNQASIEYAFWISLVLGLIVGTGLMVWWMKRFAYPRVLRTMQGRSINLNATAMQTFIYGLPGILMLVVCVIPLFYFAGLRKQQDYCIQLIRVNKLERNDADLRERCGKLDLDELMQRAAR